MKKIFLVTYLFAALSYSANSQTVVTLQHSGSTTLFYDLNGFVDAYNAASPGDTIYLPGRFFTPPSLIDKRISIIGTGYFTDSLSATGKTVINGTLYLGENADSVYIEGLYVNGSLIVNNNTSANYIIISRNYFNGSLDIQGDRVTAPCYYGLLKENYFNGNVTFSNAIQFTFCNNLVSGIPTAAYTSIISNNLFFGGPYWGWPYYTYLSMFSINNCTIQNNVFTSGNGFLSCSNNNYYNNIFGGGQSFDNNTGSGNYMNVAFDDIFVDATDASLNLEYDYHMKTPATYVGTDTKEVGIFGGNYVFKQGGLPINPHISSKNIATQLDASGNLVIDINVVAQDE